MQSQKTVNLIFGNYITGNDRLYIFLIYEMFIGISNKMFNSLV